MVTATHHQDNADISVAFPGAALDHSANWHFSPFREGGAIMLQDLFKPHFHLGSFLLRLGLATIFIFHGFLKLAQDDGANWHTAAQNVLTAPAQLAVTWGELLCGFAKLLGLLSRLAALGIVILQLGAIILQTGRLDFIHIEYVATHPGSTRTGSE